MRETACLFALETYGQAPPLGTSLANVGSDPVRLSHVADSVGMPATSASISVRSAWNEEAA